VYGIEIFDPNFHYFGIAMFGNDDYWGRVVNSKKIGELASRVMDSIGCNVLMRTN